MQYFMEDDYRNDDRIYLKCTIIGMMRNRPPQKSDCKSLYLDVTEEFEARLPEMRGTENEEERMILMRDFHELLSRKMRFSSFLKGRPELSRILGNMEANIYVANINITNFRRTVSFPWLSAVTMGRMFFNIDEACTIRAVGHHYRPEEGNSESSKQSEENRRKAIQGFQNEMDSLKKEMGDVSKGAVFMDGEW